MELKVDSVEFSYPHKKNILKNVGFEMKAGEFVGIIGPNGSGKTTLLKCINRILEPQQGKILLNGEDLSKMRRIDIAKSIGYVPQSGNNEMSSPTVYEVVLMGRKPHGSWQMNSDDEEIVWKAMYDMNIDDLATQNFDSLSSGQVQRVLMARALAQQADIMLLDEPTSNLDLKYQMEVMNIIRGLVDDNGMGACAIIHDMELTFKFCDKVILMQNGEITAAGAADEVITPENIRSVYGVEAVIDRNYGRPHVIIL
ncbi:MAG: ABC transporter ATP-binding protein [archaeon]|nr:ABC transporter ATP-binding protein [archaeon]